MSMRLRAASLCVGAVFVGAVFVLALGGCSRTPDFDYAEVEGKVTLGGKPLPGVAVTFYPDVEGGEQPPHATGSTDSAGAYTLTAATGKPGAVVGKNRVVVQWPQRERNADPDKRPPPPPGPPIPVMYMVAAETPLIVEVKAGGRQTIDLRLKQ